MRRKTRSATFVVAAVMGVGSLLTQFGGVAVSQNEDRTDSEAYTEARADYWAARAAYEAKRAARAAAKAAGEEYVDPDDGDALAADVAVEQGDRVVPAAAVAPELYPTNAQLAALRMCESTDDYTANTGNGYYGAYQFSPITWWWLGYTGYPHQASPATQDGAVRHLYSIFGWTPWPACSWYLGFR